MAASRRSPLMRDHWRAEDSYRDSARTRDRGTNDRRQISPAAPRREKDTEGGLKIKGRAIADSAPGSPSRNKKTYRRAESGRDARRSLSRSPQRQRPSEEHRSKRLREPSRDWDSERHRRRYETDVANKRRRTRSRSIEPEISDYREYRGRHRSPAYPGQTDSFRPRSRRRSKRRDRRVSPRQPSRGDYYSSSYPEASALSGRLGDSYVPGSHRRPSPPAYREPSSRKRSRSRSRSRDRYHRARKSSPPLRRPASPDNFSRKDRESRGSLYRSSPHPRETSRRREEHRRYRRESPPSSRPKSRGPSRRHRSSQSPEARTETRRSRTKMQQSPTRPIQSILDDGSRPTSRTQRIPSFDAAQGQSVQAFPMHGMKASEMHGAHRQTRPPHLNTQHSYNTSPQWTPTSSHHGSPHSGSPFSQGRGGWNAQPQHYQAQTT